ncbi:MAG TPA: response regulator [Sulfuricurvum sp.]|nr:MAG: transcriptional regulator [Campylobacterales bacterium 16-40-21]OZA03584.1 MAG: transcriptional regulator [Sulfuricurvum sp. 17-40-25]HQS65902.1 response regulator [Sulfuricurvum sp.]HQT36569.1 response regulator [Sulfuricurvum sp.]
MSSTKVLIIEDDDVTALNLKMSLEKHGYEVIALADTSISSRNKIKVYNPDIVLIDITLEGNDDGIEIARFIRDKMPRPFIFLTAHSESSMLAKAKQTEPYGYIVKPFDPINLHTTIQMALYRFEEEQKRNSDLNDMKMTQAHLEKLLYAKKLSDQPIIEFGDGYRHDISLGETFFNDEKIKLTKKETAFITLMVAQLGSVVDFEQATNYVWDEGGATDNSVRTLVWRLRSKLPTDVIKNASGIGYYLEE